MLAFILVLGSHTETQSDIAPGILYQFENLPGYGAVHTVVTTQEWTSMGKKSVALCYR